MNFQDAYNKLEANKEAHFRLRADLNARYQQEIIDLYAELFPKKNPDKLKRFANLEPEDKKTAVYAYKFNAVKGEKQAEIYDRYRQIYSYRLTILDDEAAALKRFMFDNAESVTEYPQTEEFIELEFGYGDSYRSQGWGADKYAKAPLLYKKQLLDKLGIPAEIIIVEQSKGKDAYGYSYCYTTFCLKAKCEKWVFHAIFLKYATIDDWAAADNKNGVNSKVYFGG